MVHQNTHSYQITPISDQYFKFFCGEADTWNRLKLDVDGEASSIGMLHSKSAFLENSDLLDWSQNQQIRDERDRRRHSQLDYPFVSVVPWERRGVYGLNVTTTKEVVNFLGEEKCTPREKNPGYAYEKRGLTLVWGPRMVNPALVAILR